jgi:sarcosine oxidase subunit alpha
MSGRLPPHPAQQIDRSRPLRFILDGQPVPAFEGDTIGSALWAAGRRILSRSFKYHRPRGLLCCAGRCPNCLVNLDGTPNVRACLEPAREGARVRSQHAWPSLDRDVLEVFDRLDRLLPVGFYYKTFIRPRRLWPTYERLLRTAAGLGEITFPGEPPGHYEREHLFADIAVVGGGAAGLAAALEAARWSARVVLVDDQPRLGGRLLVQTRPSAESPIDGAAGFEVADRLAAAVTAHPGVRVLPGAAAFGLYEDGLLGVLQGRRFVKLRARATVIATGSLEFPLVFENNDLPGVMLGSAAQRLLALYGVRPGTRAVVVANDDRGLDVALDLEAAGVAVAALADARPGPGATARARLEGAGTAVLGGYTVLQALGRGRVRRVVLGPLAGGGAPREVDCDLVCVTTGLEPQAGLLGQAGGTVRVGADGSLVPATVPRGLFPAGEVAGLTGLPAVLASGRLAAVQAVQALGRADGAVTARAAELREELAASAAARRPEGLVTAPRPGRKKFVCLCEDVTEKDLRQAIAEGFDHIETLKRYTTVTMGPCQGKMCHRPAVELCARMTGRTVEETGTTTARPPAQPVPLGALAARAETPWKLTAMHHAHVAAGARLMDMGPWKRPLVYSSVEDECRAVHEAVGVIDVSTLGKLLVRGRDAGAFLDWLHPNRFSDLAPGRVRYRVMCDDAGVILDDGVVARLDDAGFLLTTGTGTIDGIEQWFEWWLAGTGRCAHVVNVTGGLAAVNVAGPRSRELLAELTDLDVSPAGFPYMAARQGRVAGVRCTVLRIGFVGELGYEIHFAADYGEYLWETVLSAGAPLGIRPFGVETQRVLRLEKQHLIPGHDTDALTHPLGVALGALVKLEKPDFVGRDALAALRERPPGEQLVGFELPGLTAPPGEGAAVVAGGRLIGRVTSAKWSPRLGRVIGLAWLPVDSAHDGAEFDVRLDGTTARAHVVRRPFYDPDGLRLRS